MMALLRKVFLRAKKSGPPLPCPVSGAGKEKQKGSPVPPPPPPAVEIEVEPESLDDFVLDREVGRGSFGQAYAAHNRLNDREVCLKVTKTNEVETEALARLCDHPNIVHLYSSFQIDADTSAIEMQLVQGVDLFDYLDSRAASLPSEAESKAMARQMFSAVVFCHTNNIAHREYVPRDLVSSPTPC
jgi:serine/threonine protein kinase